MTDATDRPQSDDPEIDARRDFEDLFLRLPDLMAVIGADGFLKLLNPAWSRALGWDLDELRSRPLAEFVHPDDNPTAATVIAQLSADVETVAFDSRVRCRDGGYRWLQWTAVARRGSIYAVARDVTDAKETEAALRESQQFFESVVDNIPNMVFVKDAAELRFVRINQAGQDLLGYSQDDLFGKNDFDFFPEDEAQFFVDKDRDVLTSGAVLDIPFEPIETRLRGKRILHTKKIPILDDRGEPAYLLGIAEDITARVEGEELLRQRQETLAALASAHESQARLTEALETQRHIATTLQQSLLPSAVPAIPGVEIATRYWPSTAGLDVGGDFYDVFSVGGHRWGLVIGDVCGKGVAAAALTATARHSARAAATHVADPSDVLRWVYDAVVAQVRDRFLTMAFASLEMSSSGGSLRMSLGGHPHPILVHADGTAEPLGRFGTLIGMTRNPVFHTTVTTLVPGDLIAFYTDGLTDAPDDRALGEDELSDLLAAGRADALEGVAEAVHVAILERSGGELDDDAALLLLRVT